MVDEYKLAVYEEGHGKPLVLLHGLISTHRYWRQVVDYLDTNKWRIISPDLLGFGDSPKPRKASYSLDQQITCIEQTIGSNYDQPITMVGHSMGAVIGLRWAVKHPAKFGNVILSGLPLIDKEFQYQQIASGAEKRQIRSEKFAKLAINVFGWVTMLPGGLMRLQKTWPQHIAEDWTKYSRRAHKKIIQDPVLSDEILNLLKMLKTPTQILVGKYDGMVRDLGIKRLREIARDNKNITVKVIDGGHNIPLRFPEVVAKAI